MYPPVNRYFPLGDLITMKPHPSQFAEALRDECAIIGAECRLADLDLETKRVRQMIASLTITAVTPPARNGTIVTAADRARYARAQALHARQQAKIATKGPKAPTVKRASQVKEKAKPLAAAPTAEVRSSYWKGRKLSKAHRAAISKGKRRAIRAERKAAAAR